MAIKVLGVDHIHCNSRDLKASRDLLARLFDSQVTPIGHLPDFGFYNASVYLLGAEGKQAFGLFEREVFPHLPRKSRPRWGMAG